MYIIDLNNFLIEIIDINYALTKIDVPYNPKDFPNTYAIGKDLDIFVSQNDYKEIKKITSKYFKQYNKQFNIKIIEKDNNFRLRMEENNKLHYQIDITINDKLIQNRVKKKNYYILSLENEKIVRLFEYKKNPKKKHHKKWLINNKMLI
ncbi:MAG: hypothetical protein CMF69_03095 [Magnetovibrio sp.]|nr:hypothetical protein [Magnetovibrio sp.]|tara:strand:+ start:1631 stop:2077 length:447 start_codon:yes stop_codon:yes gene_type:complete